MVKTYCNLIKKGIKSRLMKEESHD